VPTTTPALAVEVRQPQTPPKSFWDKYGVITAIVSGVIGGILALVFNKLLSPVFEDWGEQLKEKLKGETRRFRECYIPALAEEHRYLKLVGIHGKERVSPPLLKEVYVSLRMGGTDEGLEETRALSIAEAFTHRKRLLILGEPGAGKSTLMDWLTLAFTDQIPRSNLHKQAKNLLPIFLPLRSCVADERPLHALMADPDLLPVDVQPPEDFFQTMLDRGRCLVLLDGLDEVIDERQRTEAAKKINDLVRTYPDNRYVVTCRTAGWKEDLLTGNFARLYIRDFDDTDIARFIGGWYRAVRTRAVALRGDLSKDSQQRAMKEAEQRAVGESTRLLDALKRNQSLYRLARNPLILSLIALVHYRRTRLPQGRAKLYQECLEILLETWDYEDKELEVVGPSLHAKETILQEIAYYFHSQELTEAGRDELETLIAPLLPELDCPTDAAETLRQIEERSGILVSRAIGRYMFAHRTLQEYLVARELASNPEKEAVVLLHLRDESWREVILLYSGLIGDKATELVEAILAQPDDEAHNLLILAGECLTEDVRVAPETREKVVSNLENAFQATTDPLTFARLGETLATLGGEDVVALFGRALERGDPPRQKAAIRALGQLGARVGDAAAISTQLCKILAGTAPISGWIESLKVEAALALANLGQTDEKMVATLKGTRQNEAYEVRAAALWALLELGEAEEDMIKIPAGEFLMGEGENQHTIYLPDYYIARAPVTNEQYAHFVAATEHEPPRHWKGNTPPSKIVDHPVVSVSWDDCMAYARWLGGVLLSEAEWEKAASWDPRTGRKRRYPWGDAWDSARCNSTETRPRRTTLVGQYSPEGDSAYGCVDMAGNVWEWTRSLHEAYPYDPEDGREDLKRSGSRVLRGGSFVNLGDLVRCACRYHSYPDYRIRNYGFRVGVAAAPFPYVLR
jgi:formylglycine-generating enzyme required for sulfatase activity